jgi:hypothetical protein
MATAQALPPNQLSIVNGKRVYQSTHLVSVINDSGVDISYSVSATLSDSVGNSASLSPQPQVAPGSGSQSSTSDVFNLQLSADLYSSGDVITFTCSTTASGGISASDQEQNTVTIS